MSDEEPIYLRAAGDHITDKEREVAMWLGMETGRTVIVNTAPKPRWWQFWKRKKQK